ncbi:hypothetical protein ACIQUC_16265 [Curtobacterium sp. NPDC098951]|uniref:hypothetical protein n=1 Tax=Curtobacterium sp. NPDC098951 TaxID=3363974 RepID=UPI00380E56F8
MNPAQRLLEFLTRAKEASRSGTQTQRDARDIESDDGLERQVLALQDLLALRMGIDELERKGRRVAVYRRYLREWTELVLAYPDGWTNGVNPDLFFPESTLDHLESLAGWFEQDALIPDEKSQMELTDFLRQVEDLIEQDATLGQQVKDYLHKLVREMQAALADEKVFDRFDFVEAGQRLAAALHLAANLSTDDEARKTWRGWAQNLWFPTAASALGSMPAIIVGVLTATSP